MDEQLAAIYGTGQPEFDDDDLQKTAAAELLVKLAEENGVDLNDFSDAEVGSMLGELYKSAEDTEEELDEEGNPKKKKEETAEEKTAEADWLGRVMAHAYVQELGEIEKSASKGSELMGALRRGASHASSALGISDIRHGRALRKAYRGAEAGRKAALKSGDSAALSRAEKLMSKLSPKSGSDEIRAGLKRLAVRGGGGAAGVSALVGAGRMSKSSSADESILERMAQEQAFEMAKQAGWIDGNGNLLHDLPGQQKQASAVDEYVGRRALEICAESGIPVEWD